MTHYALTLTTNAELWAKVIRNFVESKSETSSLSYAKTCSGMHSSHTSTLADTRKWGCFAFALNKIVNYFRSQCFKLWCDRHHELKGTDSVRPTGQRVAEQINTPINSKNRMNHRSNHIWILDTLQQFYDGELQIIALAGKSAGGRLNCSTTRIAREPEITIVICKLPFSRNVWNVLRLKKYYWH